MKYYAKTNTGDPKTGLISVGEVLTEKQEAALGEERLSDMVRRGVLGTMNDTEQAYEHGESEKPDLAHEGAATDESEERDVHDDEGDQTGNVDAEESEEMPELNADDIIADDHDETLKKRARRKAK